MNIFGKVLIGLILVVSLVFMSFALMTYATHRNWRDAVQGTPARDGAPARPGLNEQLQQLEAENQDLQERVVRLRQNNENLLQQERLAVAKVATEIYGDPEYRIIGANQQVEQLRAEKERLDTELAATRTQLDAVMAETAQVVEELRANRTSVADAERNRAKIFEQVTQLTERLGQLRGELARLQDRNGQLVAQIEQYQRFVAHGGVREDDRGQAPPRVVGRVVSLNSAERLVEINLGSDDGIAEGHELQVFREGTGAQFVGTVRVIRTTPERAVARVVSTRSAIERDDRVAAVLR
jgi:predicted nuclease with TOPRIM domain